VDAEENAETLVLEANSINMSGGFEEARNAQETPGKRKSIVSFSINEDKGIEEAPAPPCRINSKRPGIQHIGSLHGLNSASKHAVQWVHRIPFWLKPLIPGVFNLCNSAMRWASLIYVPASIAEMLISGLELVLSVVASRVIRKRLVSKRRWIGVGIVTLGILVVGLVHLLKQGDEDEEDSSRSRLGQWIGILLIVGQCIMSVLQDLCEELFMQEAHFPPMLLLGMEGLFGLVIGSVVYFPLASKLTGLSSEDQSFVQLVEEDWTVALAVVGLVFLFCVTGIFNILATAVTSSMTRNVWKNFRTILVWLFGLVIFYASGNDELGEAWLIPESFAILLGFAIMVYGAHVYYNEPTKNDEEAAGNELASLARQSSESSIR
jgi:hypothetical protein